jgi:hypothetical protein
MERVDFNKNINELENFCKTLENGILSGIASIPDNINFENLDSDTLEALNHTAIKLNRLIKMLNTTIVVAKADSKEYLEKINNTEDLRKSLFPRLKVNIFNFRISSLELLALKACEYICYINNIEFVNASNIQPKRVYTQEFNNQ